MPSQYELDYCKLINEVMRDGNDFIIITTDGISVQNKIHLGINEIKAFNNFIKRIVK